MKIYRKLKQFPIIFESEDLKNQNYFTISDSLRYNIYSDLKEVNSNIEHHINTESNIRTRMYRLNFMRGLLLIGEFSTHTLVIIYREDNELRAYYTSSFSQLNIPTSIITIINKFVKSHEVKLKNLLFIEKSEFIAKFCIPYEINLNDYDEEVQKKISSEFIKEELAKLNTAENE